MKTNKGILIGCIAFPLVLVLAFFIGFVTKIGSGGYGTKLVSDSWLLLDSRGMISDYNEITSTGFFGSGQASTEDVCRKIRSAATDKKIKGILIKPAFIQVSHANLGEIGEAIKVFKAGGKPVIAHGDMLLQKDYLLCAMADSIYMEASASAGLLLEGVSANILFYKEALDKLGIKMHVLQSGEYKGAGEPYSQTSLSPGTRDNIAKALKARYDLMISDISKLRSADSLSVKDIFENRRDFFISADTAKHAKLIDRVLSYDDLLREYDIRKKHSISIGSYSDKSSSAHQKDRIAVVNLSGTISPSMGYSSESVISADKVSDIIESISADKSIKAVVLRVNSPGGSALESELIYQKLNKLRQKMPVVVSMGGVAASGGYYISCASDYIFADPYAITGSIGVIMTLPETDVLGRKLGLRSQTIHYGKYAGAINLFEKYDPEIIASLKRNSESVYNEFKARVRISRNIPSEDMTAVAEGRIFSAADAKKLKLIDEIGGLQNAIGKAAALAKLDSYSTRQFPGKITIFDALRESNAFNLIQKMLNWDKQSPAQQLEAHLARAFSPNHWLYHCPYNLD
ncbi:MAG: signal peptide peptidase SppA [Candidatus Cloacimonadaceae bacterium]|nr:signal peptide peptidase SppA [Candidatus Cloacimonadaceae bacterium]MDP3114953.1 signal peptide peptidase SppA [Candidatus Cloacimonadaceae bacterium]